MSQANSITKGETMDSMGIRMAFQALGSGQVEWPKETTPLAYRLGYQSALADKPCHPPFGDSTTPSFHWRDGWLDGRDNTFGQRAPRQPSAEVYANHERLVELESQYA